MAAGWSLTDHAFTDKAITGVAPAAGAGAGGPMKVDDALTLRAINRMEIAGDA
jgi:hypothetical protein